MVRKLGFFNFLCFSILILIVFSYYSVKRFFLLDELFLLDFLMFFYVMVSVFNYILKNGGLRILRCSLYFIFFLYLALFPSLFLLVFSRDVVGGSVFISQYYFTFTILPLFFNYLYVNRHVRFFLMVVFWGGVIVCLMYVLILVHPVFLWSDIFQQSRKVSEGIGFGFRFFLGEFTPNEMGHYFVFFLLSFISLVSIDSNNKKIFTIPVVLFTFIMTLSKTVWVQILASSTLIKNKTSILFFYSLLFFVVVFLFVFYSDFFVFFARDFSTEASSNAKRISMYYDSILYLPYSILWPAFHSDVNVVLSGVNVTSVHNGFLSYISNFGLISFLMLFLSFYGFLFLNLRRSNFFIFLLIHIDFIVLAFNPMINARHVWLPLFMLVYMFYHLKKFGRSLD